MLSNPFISPRARTSALLCAVAALTSACMSMGPREPSAGRRGVEGERSVPERAARAHDAAMTAMQAGDWLTATLELEQLIEDYPSFPGPYVNLAIVYRNDGRAEEAAAMLDAALSVDPGFAPANNEIGILMREEGEFEQAAAAYRRAIESDVGYAPAHYNLGILLDLYMGRKAEALAHYQSYQALMSEPDPQIERWIVDLERRVRIESDVERVAQGDAP